MVRSACRAKRGSCVTMQIVEPSSVQVAQQIHHGVAVRGVEVAGGLVGRAGCGSPASARATATRCCWPPDSCAGRWRERCAMLTRSSASPTQRFALGRGHAAVGERQLDVLEHRQVADQVEALEDEPDLPVADARALGERQALHRRAVEPVVAHGRRVEQPEDREQRRLAAARGTGDRHVLAPAGSRDARPRARASRPRRS